PARDRAPDRLDRHPKILTSWLLLVVRGASNMQEARLPTMSLDTKPLPGPPAPSTPEEAEPTTRPTLNGPASSPHTDRRASVASDHLPCRYGRRSASATMRPS